MYQCNARLLCLRDMNPPSGFSRMATYICGVEPACEQQLHLSISREFSFTIEFHWLKKMRELINPKGKCLIGMHQFKLKSYLKRSAAFGKECFIRTGRPPCSRHHLPVRTQLGAGNAAKWRLDPGSLHPRRAQRSVHSRTSTCLSCLVRAAQLCTAN